MRYCSSSACRLHHCNGSNSDFITGTERYTFTSASIFYFRLRAAAFTLLCPLLPCGGDFVEEGGQALALFLRDGDGGGCAGLVCLGSSLIQCCHLCQFWGFLSAEVDCGFKVIRKASLKPRINKTYQVHHLLCIISVPGHEICLHWPLQVFGKGTVFIFHIKNVWDDVT